MKVTPFRDKVMILPDAPPEQTASGIALPTAWTQPPGTGTVIAVGPGRHNQRGVFVPTTVKVGDRVSYRWIDGEQKHVRAEIDGVVYVFFREYELFLVVDNEVAA